MVEVEKEAEIKSNSWFLYLIGLSCLTVVAVSFYIFYFQKDYDFIVETQCDPTVEECFYRDCTNPSDCPPNGLSEFKRYSLSAHDYDMCLNEDCALFCESDGSKCESIQCTPDEEFGESCVSPENPTVIE